MNNDQMIQEALNSQIQVPPAEWLMMGFTCGVQEIELAPGQKQKALIFYHLSSPNGVRFVFPLNEVGARNLGNELLGKPTIALPNMNDNGSSKL